MRHDVSGFLARGAMAIAALALASMLALPAKADTFPTPQVGYNADTMFEIDDMQVAMTFWHQDGKERREMSFEGETQILIVRPDTGRMYIVSPADGMAMDMGYDSDVVGFGDAEVMAAMNPVAEGRDEVAGLGATRYRLDGVGPDGDRMSGFVWVSDQGIMLKVDAVSEMDGETVTIRMDTTRIETGDQDPALFELPAGYEVMVLN